MCSMSWSSTSGSVYTHTEACVQELNLTTANIQNCFSNRSRLSCGFAEPTAMLFHPRRTTCALFLCWQSRSLSSTCWYVRLTHHDVSVHTPENMGPAVLSPLPYLHRAHTWDT
eukprot:6062784-Pyramimonas_sp.AAC.1